MTIQRWRGLKTLVQETVAHASLAIERVHRETARRSFAIVESIPPIAVPAQGIHQIHDAAVANVYDAIRRVSRLSGQVLDVVLDAVEGSPAADPGSKGPPDEPPPHGGSPSR